MSERKTFTDAVIACLPATDPRHAAEDVRRLVARVLDEGDQKGTYIDQPTREQLEGYQREIAAVFGGHDRIALVNGGATKIKGYVFEAPKLPEIRGASALLDWVNEVGLNDLWYDKFESKDADRTKQHSYIIYASGGGFLAFAPADKGQDLATAIERCYTEHTLTANSVAVTETFSLLELRYGRLNIKENKLPYWIDEFTEQWKNPAFQRQLAHYYYSDKPDEAPADRFYRRKTFGELVTLLATMTDRRRNERASYDENGNILGEVRSVPFYQLSPWDAKCDSSDVRPAVAHITVGDEIAPRELSRPSGFKRAAGQFVKNDTGYHDLADAIEWKAPADLKERAWEAQWLKFLEKHPDMAYAKAESKDPFPASDVHEIGAASRGYIGVIYADGNNVGRLMATLQTPRQYHDVSAILKDAAKDTVFQALAMYLHPVEISLTAKEKQVRRITSDTIWVHPFEILTIGGDDLFIIVPGNQALDITASISAYFEAEITKRLRELLDLKLPTDALSIAGYKKQRFADPTTLSKQDNTPSIGLSAGVIIAQENAPIFFLRDLVDELLKSAKELAKKNAKQGFYGGAIDFMVMKSITMVTDKIKSFRRQALGDDGKYSERRLTARPYTWHEFAGLLDTVRALKTARVPRSQLYRLRRALDAEAGAGITSSVMEYLYTRVRISKAYGEALQKHIEQPWCWATPVDNRTGGLPPWMPLDKKGWETIWPDLLEAYEMVPEKEQQ